MKRIYTFLLIVAMSALTSLSFAQSQRMAVVETFTGAACPPCGVWNPLVQDGMENYVGEAIYISWQVPIPSSDAMYNDNTSEVDARRDYYGGVNAAPSPFSQGQELDWPGSWAGYWGLHEDDIDVNIAEMSEFDVEINAEVLNGELLVDGSVMASMEANGDFSLFLLIGEEVIDNGDLAFPGTNGESEFHHVFKSFIGGSNGIDIADSWAMGDSYMIDESFDLATLNIYDYSKLEVTALVQHNGTKYIHQAARASELAITVEFDNTAAASGVDEIPAQCSGSVTIEPVISISNTGNTDLTSATVTYSVNGGADETYNWTGSLSTFASEDVTLPAYTFDTEPTNTLNVEIVDANGGVDEFTDDNITSADVPVAPEADFFIVLEMTTDGFADEIYWEVQDGAGNAVASGGNPNVGLTNIGTNTFPPPVSADSYANNTSYSIGIDIPALDCYKFYFADFYGDGLLGAGQYFVTDADGNLLIDGTAFSGDIQVDSYEGTAIGVGVEEETAEASLKIIGNPVVNQLELVVNIAQATETTLTVLDSQGRTIINDGLGTLGAGQYNHSYDVSGLSSGLYYVTLTTEGKVINEKVIIGQ